MCFDVLNKMVVEDVCNGLQSNFNSIKYACTYDSGLGVKENIAKKNKLKLKRKAASNYFSDKLPRKYARSNPFPSC